MFVLKRVSSKIAASPVRAQPCRSIVAHWAPWCALGSVSILILILAEHVLVHANEVQIVYYAHVLIERLRRRLQDTRYRTRSEHKIRMQHENQKQPQVVTNAPMESQVAT